MPIYKRLSMSTEILAVVGARLAPGWRLRHWEAGSEGLNGADLEALPSERTADSDLHHPEGTSTLLR